MKILGRTANGYLLEATERELANASGYSHYELGIWKRATASNRIGLDNRADLCIGTELDVGPALDFLTKLRDHEKRARDAAGVLKHMAEMIEGGLPTTVVAPEDMDKAEQHS